ncbi:MAG: deoxyribodipyrimidine photo-lyase [Verrucomicrobiales bacterium]|nr:deoxyribodipyrimidine photo-lyase [Verrucomicrobiales bacterium]
MATSPTLVWFRQDLRLDDNPALAAALARGGPVIPVYILDDAGEGGWPMGGASRWWLHHSLASLDARLRERGSRLVLARGTSAEVLRSLLAATGAGAVYWNRRYEPAIITRDAAIKSSLLSSGMDARSFNASLLFEPHLIRNKQGRPFQVFTPFWKHCLTQLVSPPVKVGTGKFTAPSAWPRSLEIDALGLLPKIPWDAGFATSWKPGEAGAAERLRVFVSRAMSGYANTRNLPGQDGTSQLSPWLHFGELGPRQIWAAVSEVGRASGTFPPGEGARVFLSEVGWREFAHHLLFHFPHTPERPLREDFEKFPWREDPKGILLRAWQKGRTGYPIVDAGMRQLWHTGWMHNRVRMVVASFLVKHLRLNWTHGAAWFWDTLVDADLASNTLGWQWTAGCGADAAPYFRVFAPVLQGERFDGDGGYVRRWVPELAGLPSEHIHAPWEAPPAVLSRAGVTLGGNYPRPLVDHETARNEALAAFQSIRGGNLVTRD